MHNTLQVPGARLRYRDQGRGSAMVLVHGWALDLEVWEPQAALASTLRVVSYDRRGFGASDGRPSPGADVDDLHELLERLQVDSPVLVGMSQGARVVLEFAAKYPARARGLVLDGPPPHVAAGGPGAEVSDLPLDQFRQLAMNEGMEAFRQLWRTHPLMRLETGDAGMHVLLARVLERYPGHDLLEGLRPGASLDANLLARIRVPAMILNGALDTEARRRAGLALRAELPCAEHTFISRAAHLPNLDSPDAYNRHLLAFARRHLPAAA